MRGGNESGASFRGTGTTGLKHRGSTEALQKLGWVREMTRGHISAVQEK